MKFYNFHTHQPNFHPDVIAIESFDLSEPHEALDSRYGQDSFTPDERTQKSLAEAVANNKHFFSVGVHPWRIEASKREAANQSFDKVSQLARLAKIVAIGETGLDKHTAKTANDYHFQQEVFISHARLSEEVKKPLIIHCVKAWDDLLNIRKAIHPEVPWIIHGFRGKKLLASRLIDAGFHLSFGMYYQMESLKEAWACRRLLLETDDKQIDIRDVYKQVADDLAVSEQHLAEGIQGFS